MSRSDSSLPELVFLPNHAGYGEDEEGRLKDFLECCRKGCVDEWTCKKTVQANDVDLFWFGNPTSALARIGVSKGGAVPLQNDGWDWTDAKTAWFCDYEPAISLSKTVTLRDIIQDRVLTRWWRGRPFQGRPKRIVHANVCRALVELILTTNRNKRIERLLSAFLRRRD